MRNNVETLDGKLLFLAVLLADDHRHIHIAQKFKFANPKYDSFEQRWVEGPDLDELGYDEGDMLGIGILVAAEIPKEVWV
jgi:hypothetical protein